MKIKVNYLTPGLTPLEKLDVGDWIDLRVANVVTVQSRGSQKPYGLGQVKNDEEIQFKIQEGMVVCVHFGLAMQLPKGYEAHILTRSSLFKKHGLLLTNAMGVIDNSYNGNEDEWMGIFMATRTCILDFNERICQFRITRNMPAIEFDIVEDLDNESRGGYGSTGNK